MRILLVEDEFQIAQIVSEGLAVRGIEVTHEPDGRSGLARVRSGSFDVLVLDIMVPGIDGLTLLKMLRAEGCVTPVLLLTAKTELGDRLHGFELGADDYLPKPFFVEELAMRLNALARRGRPDSLQVGNLKLDLLTRRASCQGRAIDLTAREYALMEFLMRSPGEIFTRTQILETVWGYDFDPATNIVDVCVRRVRNKIADVEGDAPPAIESVRGSGYRFRPSGG